MNPIALIVVAIVIYGSLHPFAFVEREVDILATLRASLDHAWSRGDALANVLLYGPVGLFVHWSLAARRHPAVAAVLALVYAVALSLTIEVAQLYAEGRVTSLFDTAFNALGATLGIVVALAIGRAPRLGQVQVATKAPFPLLLIIAWLGYRLYPFVPSFDPQAFKDALKPLVHQLSLPPLDTLRHAIAWLVIARLLVPVVGRAASVPVVAILAAATLASSVLIMTRALSAPQIVGAAAAIVAWPLIAATPRSERLVGVLLVIAIAIVGLAPFTFGEVVNDFRWRPMSGFLAGSLVINALALLEKVFLYGSLVWLARESGLSLPLAGALGAAYLLAIEFAQITLPGRVPEITDPLLAVLLAFVLSFFARAHGERPYFISKR
jgi:VanZ family protein